MSVHRYYTSRNDADKFATAVKKEGGKAKVLEYGGKVEVEYSPKKGIPDVHPEILRAPYREKARESATQRAARKPSFGSGDRYVRGSSCGRGNHAYEDRGSYFKCVKCGSSRSK